MTDPRARGSFVNAPTQATNFPIVPDIDSDSNPALFRWARAMADTTNIWFTQIGSVIGDVLAAVSGRVRWVSPYVIGDVYEANDMVLDDGWTMIANTQTEDRAAPRATGPNDFLYTGTIGSSSTSAKQVIFGQRYKPDSAPFVITGYRVDAVAGNQYRVFSVYDPTGSPVITEVNSFTASVSGWVTFNVLSEVLLGGVEFDVLAVVNEPDPAPTTWQANYSYQTPTNVTAPTTGQAQQANKDPSFISFHYTDNDATDREAALKALVVGDIISGAGMEWAIQAITDQTTYIEFSVSPLSQGSPDGVTQFTFQTVTATPITYAVDASFWSGSLVVNGIFGADTAYPDITPDDSQYGMDIRVQEVIKSDDWDVVAISDSVGNGSGSDDPGVSNIESVVDTTNNSWTGVATIPIPEDTAVSGIININAVRTDADGRYYSQWAVLIDNDSGVTVDYANLFELGQVLLDFRVTAGTDEFTLEVKGRNNQDWTWDLQATNTSIG